MPGSASSHLHTAPTPGRAGRDTAPSRPGLPSPMSISGLHPWEWSPGSVRRPLRPTRPLPCGGRPGAVRRPGLPDGRVRTGPATGSPCAPQCPDGRRHPCSSPQSRSPARSGTSGRGPGRMSGAWPSGSAVTRRRNPPLGEGDRSRSIELDHRPVQAGATEDWERRQGTGHRCPVEWGDQGLARYESRRVSRGHDRRTNPGLRGGGGQRRRSPVLGGCDEDSLRRNGV